MLLYFTTPKNFRENKKKILSFYEIFPIIFGVVK